LYITAEKSFLFEVPNFFVNRYKRGLKGKSSGDKRLNENAGAAMVEENATKNIG